MKSDKILYIIYADINNLKSLIKKINGQANNPAISATENVGEHFPCGY